MLHRSARNWQSASRTFQNHLSRRLYAVHANDQSSIIERAVADATSTLIQRLHELEKENALLKQALHENIMNKDIQKALETSHSVDTNLLEENVTFPVTQVFTSQDDDNTVSTDKSMLQPNTIKAADEFIEPPADKKPTKLFGGSSSKQFFFRLMECTRRYELSPKLKKVLVSMPLMDMEWDHHVAPAILTALVLLGRIDDAREFTNKWADHLPVLRHFMIQATKLNSSELALCILGIVAEHHNALDTFFYSCAIGACSRGPPTYIPTAYDLFDDMQEYGVPASPKTYSAILSACARLDDLNKTENVLAILDTLPNKDAAYAVVIQDIGLQNHHEFAYRLFKHVLDQGIDLPERVVRVAISSCAKVADRGDAIATLDTFIDNIPSTASPLLYNALISAYANLSPSMSFDIYDTMKEKNVPADIFTYNSVLLACVRQRDFARGLELYRAMPIQFDIVTICTMLQLCRQANEVDHASTLYFNALKTIGPSAVLFEEYVETLVENNAMDTALEVYYKNKSVGTFTRSSKLLNLLMRASLNDSDTAQAIFDDFSKRPVPISSVSWNHLMSTYIAGNKLEEAEHLLLTMQSRKLANVFSYQQLMHAFFKQKDYVSCIRVFEQFMNLRFQRIDYGVKSKPQHVPQTGLNILASRGYYELQEYTQVIAMAPSFNAPRLRHFSEGCKRELVKQSILASEQLGDWQTCVQLYGELVRSNCNDAAAYESTVRAVAKAGEFEAALDVDGGDWYRDERHSKGWFSPSD